MEGYENLQHAESGDGQRSELVRHSQSASLVRGVKPAMNHLNYSQSINVASLSTHFGG
jgi:hypothetical protein